VISKVRDRNGGHALSVSRMSPIEKAL
jgi:hypothetical protein